MLLEIAQVVEMLQSISDLRDKTFDFVLVIDVLAVGRGSENLIC
jgi:hypothetical protein